MVPDPAWPPSCASPADTAGAGHWEGEAPTQAWVAWPLLSSLDTHRYTNTSSSYQQVRAVLQLFLCSESPVSLFAS